MNTNAIRAIRLPAVAAALALASLTAAAQPAAAVKQDALQLKADQEALQDELRQLKADEAKLESDAASGRMSATSSDSYEVYLDRRAIAGEKKDIARDRPGSLQMKTDREALDRQVAQLRLDEKHLKSDAAEGRLAATSPDAQRVDDDRRAVKAERIQIAADRARLRADEGK